MTKYKDEWLLLESVEELYKDASIYTINALVFRHKKAGKDISKWYRKIRKYVYINMGYFKHIWERRRRIQFKAQEMYYKLSEKYSDYQIAKKFAQFAQIKAHNANEFLRRALFANTYFTSLTNTSIAKSYINFYNFCLNELEPIAFDTFEEECDYHETKRIMRKTK